MWVVSAGIFRSIFLLSSQLVGVPDLVLSLATNYCPLVTDLTYLLIKFRCHLSPAFHFHPESTNFLYYQLKLILTLLICTIIQFSPSASPVSEIFFVFRDFLYFQRFSFPSVVAIFFVFKV